VTKGTKVIGFVVQARMGSSRLPGKVMMPAAGKPLLGHLLARLKNSVTADKIIVATTVAPQDDTIAEYCQSSGYLVYRGSEQDVLDRYYQASVQHGLDVVVRITSDCPLIDPSLVDKMVHFYFEHEDEFDLITNRHPLTYPDGLDFDVIPMKALKYAWDNAVEPSHREHTVPFFWDTGMRVYNFEHPENLFARHRWTLDYREDYELIRTIYEALYREDQFITTDKILEYLDLNPRVSALNDAYVGR
jgi:spore coat polysaccharide biosynthesis protein SpsF